SEQLQQRVFSTDFIGLVMLMALIFFSIYIMEKEVRKSFVLKRRVRYKGTVVTHEQKKAEQLLLNILPSQTAQKLKENDKDGKSGFLADSFKEVLLLDFMSVCINIRLGILYVCESVGS